MLILLLAPRAATTPRLSSSSLADDLLVMRLHSVTLLLAPRAATTPRLSSSSLADVLLVMRLHSATLLHSVTLLLAPRAATTPRLSSSPADVHAVLCVPVVFWGLQNDLM
ncbi:hypothetical protein PF008_g31014 [Phytophthora fragariae]|uniref:Uncharacterized protein n=1 Tax=Phytophthora fragariae TaxID=53985 RepID=A0A6G0Q3Z3_9STRA|nr:hypothetical protein PF008_g31014 [Phytophthora fragariae]